MSGRPPFVAPTSGDMIASHLRQDPPVPSSLVLTLTPEIDAIVLRCLEKAAESRFQSMTELARAGAQITGENLSIETIAPLRSSVPAATPAPVAGDAKTVGSVPPIAVPNTTIGSSNGESVVARRPWRGGLFVAALVVAAIGVISFVVTRTPSQRATVEPAPTPASSSAPASESTSPAPPIDAGVAVVVPDASEPKPLRVPTGKSGTVKKPPPTATVVKPPPDAANPSKTVLPAGSASTGSGAGSQYDPFRDR